MPLDDRKFVGGGPTLIDEEPATYEVLDDELEVVEPDGTGGDRRTIEAIPDGFALCVVMHDAEARPVDCRVLEINAAFESLLGRSSEKILGRTILELLPDTTSPWIEACGSVATTGNAVRIESFSETLGVPLEVLVFRVERAHVGCLFQDISGRSPARGLPETGQDVTELRAVIKRLIDQIEADRNRLATVLHDRLRQNLTVLGMKLGMTQAFADQGDTKKIVGIVDHAIDQIGGVAESVRTMLSNLRPRKLDDEGLFAALSWYAERTSRSTPILVLLEGEPCDGLLDPAAELALFRITEHAIDNVQRHSGATRAHVSLAALDDRVVLTIVDDGKGFDIAEALSRMPGGGIVTMRERAIAAGGSFDLDSSPDGGTRIVVAIQRLRQGEMIALRSGRAATGARK